jgi:hypothetical protein
MSSSPAATRVRAFGGFSRSRRSAASSCALAQTTSPTASNQAKRYPTTSKIAELLTMLVRLRTQAVVSVTGTLASSIEQTIEAMVGQLPADFIAATPEHGTG